MGIKNRNPLRQKATLQLIQGVDDTVRDQLGYVTAIADGLYTVKLKDGSTIRGIPPSNVFTNASLGINTQVYAVIREGVPLIDSQQAEVLPLNGTESVQTVATS